MSEEEKITLPDETKNLYTLPISENVEVDHVTKDNPAHKGPFKGALDFGVELGSIVVAPFDGVVVRVVDEHDKYGETRDFIQYSNYINLEHPNGEYSELVHLAKGSAKVKVGDKVANGQELAITGMSGWMTEPHLHWLVFRKDPKEQRGLKGLEIRIKLPGNK